MSVRPLNVFTVNEGKGSSIPPADDQLPQYPRLPPIISKTHDTKGRDPPSYTSLFLIPTPTNRKSKIYDEEPPTCWERQGCLCEHNRLLYGLGGLILVIIGIAYTYEGFINAEDCPLASSIPQILRTEGISVFGYILLHIILLKYGHRQATRRNEEEIVKQQSNYTMFAVFFSVYVVYLYVLWVIGCSEVFGVSYESVDKSRKLGSNASNESWYCAAEFYDFAYYSRIGQTVIQTLIGLTILFYWIFVNPTENQRFMKRKWKLWFQILDHDQDGIITQSDVFKTNEKLESIRIYLKQRDIPIDKEKTRAWWTSHVIRRGTDSITFEQFANSYDNFNVQYTDSKDFQSAVRRCVVEFFDFFSTHEQGRNHPINDEKFVQFWNMLAGIDEKHARAKLIDFPKILTTGDVMQAWIGFLQNSNRFKSQFYQSQAVYNVLKTEK